MSGKIKALCDEVRETDKCTALTGTQLRMREQFLAARSIQLAEIVEVLREALKYYASPARYDADEIIDGVEILEICADAGYKAEKALAQAEEIAGRAQ